MHNRLLLLGPVSLTGPTDSLLRRASQQRRMALLALVASSPDASISRDRLLGLLWPDRDERTARHLLADSLYVLRQALGDDALVASGESLCLDRRFAHTDIAEFRQALSEERWSDALAVYRGDFLDGFFVRNAVDFDQWALGERTRLRDLATRAASKWARGLEKTGKMSDAVVAAERALALAPVDETIFRDLIQLLTATENRSRILRAPSRPSALRSSGSSRSRRRCAARPATSPIGASSPVSPSSTTVAVPPAVVATTGTPAARASIATTGVPSFADVSRNASKREYHDEMSST